MSTDIKPGQVWAWSNGNRVVVVSVGPLQVSYQYLDPTRPDSSLGVHNYEISGWLRYLSIVAEVATPAPLDPSKVKAGDTVTVRVAYDPALRAPEHTVGGEVWSSDGGALFVGGVALDNQMVTLTAHQPAPEPEPEWAGRFVSAVIDVDTDGRRFERRSGFVSRSSGSEDALYLLGHGDYQTRRNMSEVEDVRPLVVIDPAAVDVNALAKVIRDAVKMNPTIWKHAALQALTHLGIEATR